MVRRSGNPKGRKAGENGISGKELERLAAESRSVRRWLKGKAPGSLYAYGRNMVRFVRATGKNPDKFLAWAKTVDPVEVQDLIDQAADGLATDALRFNFKIEMRSFLRTNGYNNLPKASLSYTLKEWHRGYRKEEVRKLLSFLDDRLHKLYVYLAAETGLRARTILSIKHGHIKEDLENGVLPVAVRLGPEFYGKKKSAGFTFLGPRSVSLLKESIKERLVGGKPESLLIDRCYANIFKVLRRASRKAGLDPKIQVNHGLRKYFESALDHANIDIDQKRLMEGHLGDVRSKHYTGREWDDLRPVYAKAYPHIDVDAGDPELEQRLQSWQDEKAKLLGQIETLQSDVKALEADKKERKDTLERLERLEKLVTDKKPA